MRKFFSIMKYPISIFMGIVTYFWLIGLESYRIPTIISWLPKLIGWNVFFIICSIIVAFAILMTFMLALDEMEMPD